MFVSPIAFKNNRSVSNYSKTAYNGSKAAISGTTSFGSENIYKPTKALLEDLIKILNKTGEPLSIQNGRVRFEKAENFKGNNYKLSVKLSENTTEVEHSYTFDLGDNPQADLVHNISDGSKTISIMPIVPEMARDYNFKVQKLALDLIKSYSYNLI